MFFRCITKDMESILKNRFMKRLPPRTYLAGGTAVALHAGHRLSLDFDLFTPSEFDALDLASGLAEEFRSSFHVKNNIVSENTLVARLDQTGFRLFKYRYPLVESTINEKKMPFPIASQLDLALMKMIAVNQRGTCKDFIDLKILIEHNRFSFAFLMEKLIAKYGPEMEIQFQIRKSLVFFDDAEKDLNILMFDQPSSDFKALKSNGWELVKAFFNRFVRSNSNIEI